MNPMSTNEPSFFARYINAPENERLEKQHPESPQIEKLLDWLVNYWTKPTVTARDIYTHGPHCLRDRKTALSLAEILVEQGWLVTLKTRQRNMREWQITKEHSRSADMPTHGAAGL
jgi:hypothetical protein